MKRDPRGGFRILKLDASSQRQCCCGVYLLVERVRIGDKHFVNIVFFCIMKFQVNVLHS